MSSESSSPESSDRLLPLLASGVLFAMLMLAALAVQAQQPQIPGAPQTDAERIQSEVNRANQDREQRAQEQLRDRTQEAERQDQRRQQDLRRQERTAPSSRPTPLIEQRKP